MIENIFKNNSSPVVMDSEMRWNTIYTLHSRGNTFQSHQNLENVEMRNLAEEMEDIHLHIWIVNLNMFSHQCTGCPWQPVDALSSFPDPSSPLHTPEDKDIERIGKKDECRARGRDCA